MIFARGSVERGVPHAETETKPDNTPNTCRYIYLFMLGVCSLYCSSACWRILVMVRTQIYATNFALCPSSYNPWPSHCHPCDQPLPILRTQPYHLRPLFPAQLSQSKAELKDAVDACLELSSKGDCSKGPHGAIGEWDVSRVTDMSRMFAYANLFDGDISKWDVSSVKDMECMFDKATSFNSDISHDGALQS